MVMIQLKYLQIQMNYTVQKKMILIMLLIV